MPLYEFACSHCDCKTELLTRFNDVPSCPRCGEPLQRALSVPAAPRGGSANALPMAPSASPGACGLPQCGTFGCQNQRG